MSGGDTGDIRTGEFTTNNEQASLLYAAYAPHDIAARHADVAFILRHATYAFCRC